jgi:monoamine oxidase
LYEVIVIGAGAAGLAAAGELAREGVRVLLLEARPRIGGRVHTLHLPTFPLPVELGAEFVDVPGPAYDAILALGGAVYRSADGQWDVRAGVARPLDMQAKVDRVLERLDPPPEHDLSFLDFLHQRRADLDEETRALAVRYVEGFHAARADRVGVRWLASTTEDSAGGGGEVRHHPLGGFDGAMHGLHAAHGAGVELRLAHAVTQIEWKAGEVKVHYGSSMDGNRWERARSALITVPLGVLQAPPGEPGTILFSPEIPDRLAAAARLAMGSVVKLVLLFRSRFWEDILRFPEGEEAREHKFFMGDEPFPVWWSDSPVLAPRLTAWAGGGAAARVRAGGDRRDQALDSLARMLGVPRARVESEVLEIHFHDWDADPLTRGAYSYVPAGALEARDELRRPIDGTLFFAGEATAEGGMNGTVDGAIETGRRAAREILQELKR